MAEKKSWRDYSKQNTADKTESSKKNGSWRDYSKLEAGSGGAAAGGWRNYSTMNTTSIVGNNIVNRVNSWLQNHNSYITDYQKRYEGRKYSYEDAYVSDSADWLETARQRKSSLDSEADAILSYIDQYDGYLDEKWVDNIRKALTGTKGTLGQTLYNANKDNEWWNSFGSEEMIEKYGSAEEAYKYHQRSDGYYKTYEGMTSDELANIIDGMDDGEEKEWLTSYRSSVDYDEKSNLDLSAAEAEIKALETEITELDEYYYSSQDTLLDYSGNFAEYDAKEAELYGKYGGSVQTMAAYIQEKEQELEKKKQRLDSAKKIQELNAWSSVSGNADFGQKSQYVSNVKYAPFGKPEFTDDTYAYVNNPMVEDRRLGGGESSARSLIEFEHSAYSWDTPNRNRDSSYEREALEQMTKDEVAIYNYYYATEGPEKAREYLDLLVNTLQERKDAQTAENASKFAKEHPWISSALSVGTSVGSGFEYIADMIEYGGDKLMGKDAKLGTNEASIMTNAVRGTVAEELDWKIGNWDAFDFLYNTTMSGLDSLASTAFGGAGGVVLGLSAAAQATNDALNRGMSDGQAFWNGLMSGVFEGLFESVSIGNFNKLKETAINVGLKNIDKTVIKTIAKNLGKSMLVNASEEMLTEIANITYDTLVNGEFANYTLEELFEKGAWKKALNQVIESGASGALMGLGMSSLGSAIGHKKGINAANEYAVKNYGKSTDTFIQEGLENDVKSSSYKLATKYQQQVQGKNGKQGKALTGQQIRNLLAANQEQITPKDMKLIQQAAEKRLTDLGQTEEVANVAELATKYATGGKLSRAEKSFLANSQYGSRVANELLPSNIESGDYATEWAEEIGTKQVNYAAYNKKEIVRQFVEHAQKLVEASTYKSLESRMEGDVPVEVSDTGKAVIRSTDEEIDLTNPNFKAITEDGVVLDVNGKDVRSNDIDYDSEEQGLAINAIGKIEHITPAAAGALYAKVDMTKPVMGQLNGMDEAFTYGYYKYSEADLEAGLFTKNLTKDQLKDAYNLGRYVAENSTKNRTEAIKKMRTAADAIAEKNAKDGKETPKAKNLTITYNHGGGVIEDIETAEKKLGKLNKEKRAGIEVAKILHQMGIGTDYEFFTSYFSKTLKDEDGNPLEVFLNDEGQEEAAYAGIYMAANGKIRINLNAYSGTKGLTLNALSHELTHFIKTWSLEKYEAMAEFLVKSYGEHGVSMHQLVLKEQARLKGIRGEDVSYGEAYDEVVANAFNRMLEDGKVMDRIAEIRQLDKSLGDKIIECIRNFIKRFMKAYQKNQSLFHETEALMEMKEVFEQLQNMFAEALVEASDNFQASLIAKEAGLEVAPVEDSTQYSYQSLAEAAGFEAVQNEDGTRSFVRDGKVVSKVTVEDIENSPIGAFINFSLEMKDISEADAKRQKEMFAKICTMACKTNDFAMTMQFVGSAVFTGMKANADKQYGTTYDFPSICTKTQAVIDAMSAKMMSLGRGLKTDEIVKLYDDVFASGNPVPCPECYVFSRWIGIGGLLDNIKKYQDYYGGMDVKDVAAAYLKMKAEVSKFADEQGISFGKAKGALTAKLTKEYNKLNEKIEKAQNQGEKVKPADKQRLAELEPMMNTVKSMTWLENVYFADSSLKKVNPNFRVPDSVLFDLNNGEAFATKYKEAWAFRTTQGAGYGKAITPYAEARLGEGILVTNNTSNAIKGKAQGSLNNYFLNQKGKLDKQSRDALKRARLKQKIQAFIGGQRFQSTSDARYENASDYLLAALEMQAMGGMVQVYTKVDGAVPAFSAWGFSINQSLMPLNGGLDENGNVQDTPVGGMKREVAFDNRKKHETAGTITIGVNDNHIRKMFKEWVRDFIIPYHASGGKADVVAEFRRIQEGNEAKGKAVRSTDYSRTQSDKVLSDDVLRWQGKTDAQIQRIHEIRNARIAILTGGNPNMTVVRSNRFLSALYDKLNGGEWDGVKLAKSKVESQIFPNEFWDQTVTYEESAKITKDYLEYCDDLGFLHRFSGTVPSNGKLVPVNGYNENGERVQLTDLAYQYDENGNKTADVEPFFWKVLTDRRMYDNSGNYLPQKVVTLNDTTADTVTGFAKNNQGREYDKAKAEALAKKILDNSSISNENNLTQNQERGELSDNRGIRKGALENARDSEVNGKGYPGNPKNAQKNQEWGNIGAEVQGRVRKLVKTNIEESHRFDEIFALLSQYVGKTDATMDNRYYEKAVGILAEEMFTNAMAVDLPLFEGQWSPLFESAANLYRKIRETVASSAENSDSATTVISDYEYQQLMDYFGTTKNYDVAGYLLKNGLMLDFSGKHWGATDSIFRQVDHRDVWDAWEHKDRNNTDEMVNMIGNGNIRLMPESGGINLAVMPNESQLMTLRGYINHFRGEVIVDVDNAAGEAIHSFSYNKGTSSSKIIADIKAYFEKGTIPEAQSDIGKFLYSSQQTDIGNAPTFYSQMGKVVEGMKQEKFGASSVISMLRGRGVKAEEIRWSGIQAFLDGKKSVTKQELLDFINSSMLHIEETMLDGSKGEPVKLPNNYRLEETENGMGDPILNLYIDDELVDTFEQIFDGSISSTGDSDIWAMNEEDLTGQILSYYAGMSYDEAYGNGSKETKWDKYTLDGGDNYRELLFKMPGSAYDNQAMEAHWGDHGYGVLAHARIQDFNTFIGKMLFIEEIQSDWHNAGQRSGYRKAGEKTAEQLRKESDKAYSEFYGRVESMFNGHKSHCNPALMANLFEGDADAINFVRRSGFTDEEMKYIKSAISEETARKAALESAPSAGAVPDAPFKDNYHEYVLKRLLRMAAEEGYDSIGWTTADIQSDRWSSEYAEGYRIEYDQDIPKFLKKYGKQWGSNVGKTTLDNGTEVWSMAITDSMQKSVLKEGQALYSSQQTDRDYMAALDKGDMVTAQRLVDKAAKAAGYTQQGYHGTGADFNIFSDEKIGGRNVWGKGFYFGTSKGIADDYASWRESKGGKYRIVSASLKMENPYIPRKSSIGTAQEILDKWFPDMWQSSRELGLGYIRGKLENSPLDLLQFIAEHNKMEIRDVLASYGYDSVKDGGELVIFSPTQIKSNEPVVWDDNGKIIPLSKRFNPENKDIRYSTQQTDNITNRHLLANAFEGITNGSEEYKLIQKYKGYIAELNSLEKKLIEFNRQIREIRFTEGKYDAEKLRKIEGEAEKIRDAINKYDQYLLSLEASEPLRKVIVRERKKEAQKTKEHINEIQQNKKVRAEQTEYRHKIRKAIRDLDKLLNRGNKKTNVKEGMRGFASKALELADYLFTDHISNDELIRKGITVRMTPKEAALVKETEDILSKLYDHADSLTDEEFTRLDAKRKSNLDKLRDLLTAQRNDRLNTPVYNLFNDLVTEYAKLKNSNQDAVKAAYNPEVERFLRSYIGESNGETDSDRKTLLQNMRVADMTTDELWKLHNAYKMVLHSVRTANDLFVKGKTETVEKMVERISIDFGGRKTPEGKVAVIARNLANKIGWDYEKLHYALDRIGSEAFTELVMNIANSENIVMQDVIEAALFRDEMVEKYGFNNWKVNKEIDREFLDNTGKKFKLTLGQLMALYAYSRREGAWDHIEYGGFVFGEAALTNPKPADSYKLTREQVEAITSLLTAEQKGYAEDMQKYLSETMGEKGNEVSMLLYGIKMFGEKNYFPIHIAGQFKAQAQESQAKAAAGFSSMSNAGFTHAQNPNAKAPFVLEGFNEIWADHVNEMSRYHGTVPALEDMRKVMNRSFYSDSGMESMAIKQLMENSFGKEAVEYFDNLYREANSGAITDKMQKWPKKLLSLFRKNSVAYSLSVIIQQPSAMARAYAMIDKKYFGFKGVGALTSGVVKAVSSKWNPAYANAYNEMLKYATGVTMAKEIGGFDTHTGSSIREYLLDTGKSLKQSWKTENLLGKGKAVLDLVDDNAIANLPNVADKIAWIEIWNACKRETLATHKDLAPNSEEFMQIVGDRFTEVIRATQVYDSMFSKSPMLKSKNLAVQYLVSFMNEPNTTVNMVEKAVRDATNGDWKGGLRIAGAVTYSIIFNNVLKAIIYAMRDDDEDETYIEKYLAAVAGGMMDDFLPFNYIPIVRDVWSKARGFDVERPDMAIITDAIDAVNAISKVKGKDTDGMTDAEIAELDKKVTEASWKLVGSLAAFFGIPVKNIYREIEGVIDHARIASSNAGMTTASGIWDKVTEEVIDSIPFMSAPSKQDKLYEAIISGDKAYLGRLKSTYKTEDAYQSAVRKALRENDPRIQEAAQARYYGNTEEYKRIFREIKNEGKFSFDDIMSAINTELSKLTPDKVTSDYTASGYVEAVAMGNMSNAQAMKDDIIATKVANGKTQSEAEKEFRSSVATAIGDAYSSGLLDEAGAEKMLMEYADKDEEEAASKVRYWSFSGKYPGYDLNESNVNDYLEFAEPANISLDVFTQYVEGTKGLADIKDEWGDVEVSKREQVLEVIDSLPLTWQQKDALYLAAGYAESKIWDVPW